MKVLARYEGDVGDVCVCELADDEVWRISPGAIQVGVDVEVQDLVRASRDIDERLAKANRVLSMARRYEALLKMLTQEIEAARLAVSRKEIPDIKTAHALTNALETIINGQNADSDH